MSTNVRGVFLGMRTCVPVMAGQGQGSIINLSSMDGNVGSPGYIAYGGSKRRSPHFVMVSKLQSRQQRANPLFS
jgi:NAD(P)-dependent dehydrogenase (short-subunit alcohol dehydrogenase family)